MKLLTENCFPRYKYRRSLSKNLSSVWYIYLEDTACFKKLVLHDSYDHEGMIWLSVPSVSVGIESLKNWVDYWRKFKGKRVRIWFIRKDGGAASQFSCKSEAFVADELKRRNPGVENIVDISYHARVVEACTCVDGKITDVVDSPFGIMLTLIIFWKFFGSESRKKPELVISEGGEEIVAMFIPMSEIARIDFLSSRSHC